MNQNLSLYQIFYVTARHGNISHAAKELFISQPAISKSIRKLEEALQVPLFTRSSRGVALTEMENFSMNRFRKLSAPSISPRRHCATVMPWESLSFASASVQPCAGTSCFPISNDLSRSTPHVKVTIHCQSSYQTIELLENRQIDLGLIGRPAGKLACHYQPLQSIQDTFVCTHTYLETSRSAKAAKT